MKRIGCIVALGVLLSTWAGCAHIPDYYREDGPSATANWDTPTVTAVRASYEPAARKHRDWEPTIVHTERGAVAHWPLYFEDPFEDQGHGRTDATHPHNVYHRGWEDCLAAPYGFARFTANWLLLPVSAIVTPPWTVMESDGKTSKQLIWHDHDATTLRRAQTESHEKERMGHGESTPPSSDDAKLAAR
jgi:hypothetical protein